jgi:hypothetical protein
VGGPPFIDENPTLTAEQWAASLNSVIGCSFKLEGGHRAVRILRRTLTPADRHGIWYAVEDLATGFVFDCSLGHFDGDELTDMEVIAWASR